MPARIACFASVWSAGARTIMFGSVRMIATSSSIWWVLPVMPVSRPA
jgi:hypothetical protein